MKAHVWRIGAVLVTVLLCIWALAFYFASYELSYDDDGVAVSCYSVAKIDSIGGGPLDGGSSSGVTYSVVRGESALQEAQAKVKGEGSPGIVSDRIEHWCDQVRTVRVAKVALLLAPAAVLASVAILWPRRRGSAA